MTRWHTRGWFCSNTTAKRYVHQLEPHSWQGNILWDWVSGIWIGYKYLPRRTDDRWDGKIFEWRQSVGRHPNKWKDNRVAEKPLGAGTTKPVAPKIYGGGLWPRLWSRYLIGKYTKFLFNISSMALEEKPCHVRDPFIPLLMFWEFSVGNFFFSKNCNTYLPVLCYW